MYLVLALALAAAPAWACTPESEFDCDLLSRSCQRINSESCAKKNFGEGENTKYGSEVDCLAQNGVNGFVTQWCPEKPLLAGCKGGNRFGRRPNTYTSINPSRVQVRLQEGQERQTRQQGEGQAPGQRLLHLRLPDVRVISR